MPKIDEEVFQWAIKQAEHLTTWTGPKWTVLHQKNPERIIFLHAADEQVSLPPLQQEDLAPALICGTHPLRQALILEVTKQTLSRPVEGLSYQRLADTILGTVNAIMTAEMTQEESAPCQK